MATMLDGRDGDPQQPGDLRIRTSSEEFVILRPPIMSLPVLQRDFFESLRMQIAPSVLVSMRDNFLSDIVPRSASSSL